MVWHFKQQFLIFKQHYMYFHAFSSHVFPKNTNNVIRTMSPNGSSIYSRIYSCDHIHSNMIELFYLVNLYNAQKPNPCQTLQYNLIEEGLCCNFNLKTSRSFNTTLETILRTKPFVHTVATISLFLSMFSLSL